MKRNKKYFTKLLLGGMLSLGAGKALAVEVGDIYYDDKTFSSDVLTSKRPVGLVYWVADRKDHGYIMQLDQNAAQMNYYLANQYCAGYYTGGTKAGDWSVPRRIELNRMGTEKWLGVANDKFNYLNTRLAAIKTTNEQIGKPLIANQYYWSDSYYGYAFYLNIGGYAYKGTGTGQSDSNFAYVRCVMAF